MPTASRHKDQPVEEDIAIPADMLASLRSDHAGESGAVCIYQGILAVTRDAAVRKFAPRHKAVEERHLEIMQR